MKASAMSLIFLIMLFACQEERLYCDTCDGLADMAYNSGFNNLNIDMSEPATGDRYKDIVENPFIKVSEEPVSTFSIDADGASYANVRRFLSENTPPPSGAIRTEELINYFAQDYPETNSNDPISVNGEVSLCPWQSGNKLIRIGIKGHDIPRHELPASNFVFLIDVSGSMSSDDKLHLLKEGFLLLVDELSAHDRIAIVTYAGSAGVVLESTAGDQKETIKDAIRSLGSGGSTAGAEGILSAYEIAQANLIEGGNNRVILGTDGDFNVGISNQEELITLIEGKRDLGIFLTVLGVGRGNLNDGMLEQLANNGNGTYEYIDRLEQAKKVFIYEHSKFYTAAKDVKVQVHFNSSLVEAYRLIGYENRLLNEEDFTDDKKDAGEIGVGQSITALYEIKPASSAQLRVEPTFTINFRYKQPDADTSIPIDLDIFDEGKAFTHSSRHMRFTASLAGFGMLLRDSEYKGTITWNDIYDWSSQSIDYDPHGFKAEFVSIVLKMK
ncbi:MAG: VWA domain-containing protein [Cyclobacteriaceae bacterium]|nr:VWA domain-containing protein [Cyclobacteriaceae bacterium]